jgi:hypothetical protein
MANYKVQVTLNHDSALPEDQVVNTWHVSGTVAPSEWTAIRNRFTDFYGAAGTGMSNTIMARLSSVLDGTGRFRAYNLADPLPRVPVHDGTFTGLVPGGTALPSEAACCLSYKAAGVSGTNSARRRNRVYIGPLAQSAMASTTNPMIDSAFRTDLTKALQILKTAIQTATSGLATLVGFSPTDGVSWTIDQAWVDDAPDTQRRRGKSPTTRTTLAFT